MTITLYRDAAEGPQRLYTISDQQLTLPGVWGFTVAWTAGGSWRERHKDFASQGEMDRAVRALIRRKLREGFRLLYSYDPASSGRRSSALPEELRRMAR